MPRSRRAVLGRRLEDAAFDFHEAITAAAKSRDPRPALAQADLALNRWRLCLRLAVRAGGARQPARGLSGTHRTRFCASGTVDQ